MGEETKENPFRQEKISKITKIHVEDIEKRGGIHLRIHDLDNTPSYMVRDQDRFQNLPIHKPSNNRNAN